MKSFDMHFSQNSEGKWCVSYTLPSGSRTAPVEVSDSARRGVQSLMFENCIELFLLLEERPKPQTPGPNEWAGTAGRLSAECALLEEKLGKVRDAHERYQRNDLSREEFEGVIAEIAEAP